MKDRVIVTGGSGFIGSNLVRRLVKEGYDVNILLRKNSNTWRIGDILHAISPHYVSLSDQRKLSKIISSIEPAYIFHLAAYGNYAWQSKESEMTKVNYLQLQSLLNISRKINYKCFINAGSSTEYGFKNSPFKETDGVMPESFYGATKAAGTIYSQTFSKRFQKPVMTFRFFSVYGPYEEKARFIPTIIRSAIERREVSVTKEPIKRDFIHVDDVVEAFIKAIKKPQMGEIINLGTGKQYSNKSIIAFVKKIQPALRISDTPYPVRHWDSSNCVADIKKAQTLINWKPKYDIKVGLFKTYQWFLKNKNIYSDQS